MGELYFRVSLTRESDPLLELKDRYHGLVLEAHILELYSNSIATFLAKSAKPYLLDSALYRFWHTLFPDIKDKRWAGELLDRYGLVDPISEFEDGLQAAVFPIEPGKGKENPALTKLVGTIIDYQRGRVPEVGQGESVWAALTETPSQTPPTAFGSPEALVAPYVVDGSGPATSLNVRLLKAAISAKSETEKLYAVLPVPPDYLSASDELSKLIAAYHGLKVDGVLVWVADFKEGGQDSHSLSNFGRFIRSIRSDAPTRKVFNLFGGFYSTLLVGRDLLDGSIQGVGISEHRDPFATGGGGVPRFYLPLSRQSVSVDLASDMRQLNPTLFACECPTCKPSGAPSQLSSAELAKHFIRQRSAELDWAKTNSPSQMAAQLQSDAQSLLAVKGAIAGVAHTHGRQLQAWASSLTTLAAEQILQ